MNEAITVIILQYLILPNNIFFIPCECVSPDFCCFRADEKDSVVIMCDHIVLDDIVITRMDQNPCLNRIGNNILENLIFVGGYQMNAVGTIF